MKGEALWCILNGHVGCYCSCFTSANCCGCSQSRPSGRYYLHCLYCNTDFTTEVHTIHGGTESEFDTNIYRQGAPLDEAQARIKGRK
jgi:hypothetical protein